MVIQPRRATVIQRGIEGLDILEYQRAERLRVCERAGVSVRQHPGSVAGGWVGL
jgi:hypothetical protein